MVIATQQQSWKKSVLHTAKGFEPTMLPVLSGSIPAGLRGSLYRNGPARLERGGMRVAHWFDGDGAILGIHFTDRGATGVYRYVQSKEFEEEEQAGQLLYGGYGSMPSGGIIQRFTRAVKNAGNTSVLTFPDRLLALWEGGHPHALDLETLETQGLDDLGGLSKTMTFSAHPKRDPKTGDTYSFGVSPSKNAMLNVYRINAQGQLNQHNQIELDGLPIVHDFVMAGQYLFFFISPVRADLLPLLLRFKSYSDSLQWQPEKGTQILVVDRDSLEVVSRGEAEPWYQWHFGNGAVDADGNAVIDLVRYEDFDTNQFLKEVATGETQTIAESALWQIKVDPLSAKPIEMNKLVDRSCEFPIVQQREVGQPWRHTYFSLRRRDADPREGMFGAIARFDHETGELVEADCGANRYPMEPIYAADAQNPDQGWIVTVVYDADSDRSEVYVYDADRLSDAPVCRLELPEVIPIGFHGTWRPA